MNDTQPVAVATSPAPVPPVDPAYVPPSPVQPPEVLDVFDKMYAERQQRIQEPPLPVKFGGEVLRLYRHTPASAVFDAMSIETDPAGIRRALEAMVIAEDRAKLHEILQRDASHPGSIDDQYVGDFLGAVANLLGGRPLGA